MAQLALRRSWYLGREMQRINRSQPDAAMVLGRSMIETALVGAYLAIHGDDAVRRFTKKQAGASRRLQQRFDEGDPLGALKLLGQLDFVAESLDEDLIDVDKLPNFIDVCKDLDTHPPFDKHNLATLFYEEVYSIYSNHVVHPTPSSLRRHQIAPRVSTMFSPFTPKRLIGSGTLAYSTWPAVGALCSVIARQIGRSHSHFDSLANEVAEIDGYSWSSSPARVLAAQGLADLCDIRSIRLLNRTGIAIRLLEIMGVFEECESNAEQLLIASQVFDEIKNVSYVADRVLPQLYPTRLLKRSSRKPSVTTSRIANGEARSNPQALLAALGLCYCGAWPDSSLEVDQVLQEIDDSAPHTYVPADNVMARRVSTVNLNTIREIHRYAWPRWKRQVDGMQ